MANAKGNVHPNWAAAVKWTPELQEKKRRTRYATRIRWIRQGRPRIKPTLRRYRNMPTSASEAKARGLRHYFTGKPCQYGHLAVRRVTDWNCLECHRLKSLAMNDKTCTMPMLVEPSDVRESAYREIVL